MHWIDAGRWFLILQGVWMLLDLIAYGGIPPMPERPPLYPWE